MNKEKFMKNGVFSLEYDKETLRDMVLELQEKLEAYENMRKEAIEYLKENSEMTNLQIYGIENVLSFRGNVNDLLSILNKVGEDNE